MRPSRFALAVALALVAVVPQRPARAECDRDICRFTDWQVELVLPPGWHASEETSYPGILVFAVHEERGGRMTLGAQKLESAEVTAEVFAKRTREVLAKLRYTVGVLTVHPTGAAMLEATTPDRKRIVRQAFVAHGGAVYVLTLAAPAGVMKSYYRAFDDTLRSLTFSESANNVTRDAE